jgi:hypothetical protein
LKKVTNTDYEGDIWKLKGLTEQAGEYGYLVGLHVVVDVKAGVAPQCDVYIDAELNEDLSVWMRARLTVAA